MSPHVIADGLISYICLIILITFHEFGHAWMAWKRGDDTARLLGRISLNPVVHMEVMGTVVLPLLGIFLGMAGSGVAAFIIGWGKPVPVNSRNLKNPNSDWVLVAMAGPAMNIVLAAAAMALVKAGIGLDVQSVIDFGMRLAWLNLYLCFFNLLPIPPLDGSHLMRYFVGMTEETFLRISQFGLLFVLIALQVPGVRQFIAGASLVTIRLLARIFGIE